ncbi:hypothetical protein VOLCADRAFT_95863 [Volvox carteri f. nagariensis]|uniref:Uncharacterized protein n=1 Tax=Volvox carteri f. nagariensis TaxID=3068 RepID=D8U8K6_VOLCA|nr:uncharacterized protein VOLCADRAFT_95863 [Volvox carteri f. nagariensis]EFJ43999.1 hypothetical protein VOLCADRAFT_95863 [Volvox carteri f. nagariensis]|eukprot:XP_002955011.1 hypothetical protein VOLCADRAFT_95863 [Volvox carteri f. nagariensis]
MNYACQVWGLILYMRVRAALTNPKYNYFSGLAAAVPAVLSELQEEVLSSFTLNARLRDLMQRLAVWTQSCEISVASAVHAGIGDLGPLLLGGEGGLNPRTFTCCCWC